VIKESKVSEKVDYNAPNYSMFFSKLDVLDRWSKHQILEMSLARNYNGYYYDGLRFSWQRTVGEYPLNWYAFKLEIASQDLNYMDELLVVYKKVRRYIVDPPYPEREVSPTKLLEIFTKLKLKEAAKDPREGNNLVLLEKLADPNLGQWRDAAEDFITDKSGCKVWQYARDEAEARVMIEAELLRENRSYNRYSDYILQWQAAGRPVKLISYDLPDYVPLASKLEKVEADEKAKHLEREGVAV
jgi:hypothetical protein